MNELYENYKKYATSIEEVDYFVHVDDPQQNCTRLMTEEEFLKRLLFDERFNKLFSEGKTTQLLLRERMEIFRKKYKNKSLNDFKPKGMEVQSVNNQLHNRLDNAKIENYKFI